MKTNKAVSIHKFHTHKIRTILINNVPYFVLADVCKVLDLESTNIRRRLEDGVCTKHPILDKLNRSQEVTLINEDGLYDVIFESRKPEAKAFRKWVTSEILPSIRKTGSYNINNSPYHLVNKHLTSIPYKVTIALVMGVKTHRKCSCPTALVASYNIQDLHYDRRALNKLAIANKAGLSFSRFFTLLSPLHQVTREKEKKMKNLISIKTHTINHQPVNTVNARELHEFLESKRKFADWIKQRIEQYGFVLGEDYVFHKFVKNPSEGGRPSFDYYITLDMAKELAMVENNSKGKQARKYFIECERKLLELSPYHLVNKHLTVPSYNINIVTTGVRTLASSVSYATNDIVASLNTSFPIFVFSGRAKNTIPEREIIPLNLFAEFLTSRVINNSSKKEQTNMENSNCTNGVSNQIISISKHSFNGKETNTVNARELYNFLNIKTKFADWIVRRISKYEFQENIDYLRLKNEKQVISGTKYIYEYYLTITMAKELAMVENNSKGKQARKYFIECERKLLELSPYHLVNKHSTGFNNINTEAELVHAAKANLSSLVNTLEELNIANIVYRKGRWVYNYALNKREYIKKETLKDYLQHQVDILSRAFNIMYQPYYKEIINLEHSKKYKELQKFLAKRGGCKCCY